MEIISCHEIVKSYRRKQVLRGCSFNVCKGETVGLTGENGCGKSTLIRCLLGYAKTDSGFLKITRSLGYCPQDNYLNARISVSEHFSLMQLIYSRNYVLNPAFFTMIIDKFKLHNYLNTLISELSGGTYQKVKFITSIIHTPELIVLDEPCDGFDWGMYHVFWDVLGLLKKQGATILIVSHFFHDLKHFDKLIEIKEGQCECSKGRYRSNAKNSSAIGD